MDKIVKVVIVSTFRGGSLNIGDHLITKSTIATVRKLLGRETDIRVVFRAEKWELVEPELKGADFIIFACLAIRKNLSNTYAFLPEVIASRIPYGVLAAGTSLNVSSVRLPFSKCVTEDDQELLRDLAAGATFFNTRGMLTQAFCESIGLHSASLTGDIAFVDGRFEKRLFPHDSKVLKIAVSDPHYENSYRKSFVHLISGLRRLFPEAEIDLLLHGVNELIKDLAVKNKVAVREIYLDSESGLDTYDNYDLHVGYRVHGHVSSLSRRKPSYLLEQDGRGCDYGLTISRKISVAHYRPMKRDNVSEASTAPVDILMSMVTADQKSGFSRFKGLECEIQHFVNLNLKSLRAGLPKKPDFWERVKRLALLEPSE